ncbi:hypothetical protein V5799_026574 [Amblyomma americanum]|uniref:SAC3/GANP/THP3 conserved domain-containing protein n=1 Tax=Amblyomma americanum TaxID=6943 RepID=A0AAQ4DI70_AMBAM
MPVRRCSRTAHKTTGVRPGSEASEAASSEIPEPCGNVFGAQNALLSEMFKKPGDPSKTADGKDQSQRSTVAHGNPFAITASAASAPTFSFGTAGGAGATFGAPATPFAQSAFGNASKLSFGSKWECPTSSAPVFDFGASGSSGTAHGGFGLQASLFSGKGNQPALPTFGATQELVLAAKTEPQAIPVGAKEEQDTGLLRCSAGVPGFGPAEKAPASTPFDGGQTGSGFRIEQQQVALGPNQAAPGALFGSKVEPGPHQNQPIKLFVSSAAEKQQLFGNVVQSSALSGTQSHQVSTQPVPASFASIALSQPVLQVSSLSSLPQSAASGSVAVFGQKTAFGNQPHAVNQPSKAAQPSLFGRGQGVAEKTGDKPSVIPLFSAGQVSFAAGQDQAGAKPALAFSFAPSSQQQAPPKPSMLSNLHKMPTASSAGTVGPLASSKAISSHQQPQLMPAKTAASSTAFAAAKTSMAADFFGKAFDKQADESSMADTTQSASLPGPGQPKQQVARSLFGKTHPTTESLSDANKKSSPPPKPGGFVFDPMQVKEPALDSAKGAGSFSFVTQTKQDDRELSSVQQPGEKSPVPQIESAGSGLVQVLSGEPGAPTYTKSLSQASAGGDSKREGRKLSSDGSAGNRVTATPEEISMLTTLLCNQLPAELNDREVLLEHFGQFGRVERISCNLKRKCATIRFSDHHSAEMAKKRGARISPQFPPLEIFWCSKRRPSGEGRGESKSKPQASSNTTLDDSSSPGHSSVELHTLERPTEGAQAPLTAEQRPARRLRSQLAAKGIRRTRATAAAGRTGKGGETGEELAAKAEAGESLLSRLKQAAHSVGERYRVLDARDKIIRLRLEKQSDLATAQATKGCCPDMCPEKERYSRTDKKCLSTFEVLPGSDGVMDHTRMVKEYSRSSADQEEPLAHELRPPHVLRHTMDYLIVHLMDYSALASGGGTVPSVGEWYDFIWNRTRSIRKVRVTPALPCGYCCLSHFTRDQNGSRPC